MKRLISTLLLLLTANIVYSYDFHLDLKTNSVKDYTCVLQYDDTQKNLSFDKGFSQTLIKKEVNNKLSLVCTTPITIIKLNLYNDNRELIYSEQTGNKKSYQYLNHISKVDVEFEDDNNCSIKTDSKVETYELNKDTDLELDFIKVFSMSCDSSLEGSTLRVYDDTNYNLKYKVFEKNQKSFTVDLDKPVINYNTKVELYLRPYDSKDKFKCVTSNNGKRVEFTNTDHKLMMYKSFYSTGQFKLDCDYKFKQIQLFSLDSYFDKDINEFEYFNVSNINEQVNKSVKKVIKKVIPKPNPVKKVEVKTPTPVIKEEVINVTQKIDDNKLRIIFTNHTKQFCYSDNVNYFMDGFLK